MSKVLNKNKSNITLSSKLNFSISASNSLKYILKLIYLKLIDKTYQLDRIKKQTTPFWISLYKTSQRIFQRLSRLVFVLINFMKSNIEVSIHNGYETIKEAIL